MPFVGVFLDLIRVLLATVTTVPSLSVIVLVIDVVYKSVWNDFSNTELESWK